MAAISANQVKTLREKSGAGMMECKKALEKTEGDIEKAMKLLRESGAAKAAKRADRTAAEGLVALASNADNTAAAVIELNSETDFVARNDEFKTSADGIAAAALEAKANSVDALKDQNVPGTGKTVAFIVDGLLARIGEKIGVNRVAYLEGDLVSTYLHPPGKIGVVIAAKLEGVDRAKANDVLRNVAMHIAAMGPQFLDESQVDQATIENEKDIYTNIARKEGKPENIIPKIVEGKVKAFYKEACLLDNVFAIDTSTTVGKYVEDKGKEAGGKITIESFVRLKVGETVAAPAATE